MAANKPRKVTYLGQRAEVKVINLGGGVKEVRTRWIDPAIGQRVEWPAGSVVSKSVRGDFTKGTGVVLVNEHLVEEF